jgi:hypothetical protein
VVHGVFRTAVRLHLHFLVLRRAWHFDCKYVARQIEGLPGLRNCAAAPYAYLLKAYGDANRAKADFIRFLSGELPPRIVRTASAWISEEQGDEIDAKRHNGHAVPRGPDRVGVDFTGAQA